MAGHYMCKRTGQQGQPQTPALPRWRWDISTGDLLTPTSLQILAFAVTATALLNLLCTSQSPNTSSSVDQGIL